ncbi:hypothetical protein ACLB90_14975 [Stenotrophomonas sp. LGBM10]|uniref:hypothetical protein n=1 Tax=Stenotrophomonas sp. LGBM10 TaxID=3390038 RepID=UPI00398B2178
MRFASVLLPLLLIAGCSCQRQGDADAVADVAAAMPPGARATTAPATAADTAAATPPAPPPSAVAAGATDEPATVRNYIGVLLRGDRAAAAAYWRGGTTSTQPDDAPLHHLTDVVSLRVDTDTPIARDTAHPSRLREVPVRIRVLTRQGTLHYHGWYRLAPRADGSGWELSGASLQPTLD